jgi:outer membrane receptor protein involved in Fe transport
MNGSVTIFKRHFDLVNYRSLVMVLAVSLVVVLSIFAFSQAETASISGTVKDSSGALVTGAQVTVTSVGTSAARTATTDNSGSYTVTNLEPGLYEIRVSHPGFGDFKQRFNLAPGARSTQDATLAAAGTETFVEVIGQSSTQVDTQTSSITEVVDQIKVSQLPSLTRDPYDFVQTMGNVNQDTASGTGGSDQIIRGAGVAIGGQRSASTDALLDGAENVNLYTTKVGQSVPLDAVQEFSVTSSNFSAEYGRASGGVINVVTKSGSNDLHGSLYEFNRLSALTTNDVDDIAHGNPKGKYTRNQFGYSLGGPVVKNKLFFFSATEFTRVRSKANVTAAIPDATLIAQSAPATQALFGAYTLRSGLTVNGTLTPGADPAHAPTTTYATYAATGAPALDIVSYLTPTDSGGGAPQNTYNMVHRLDFNLSNNTSMYGRYALFNQNEFAGFVNNSPYTGFDTGQTQRNQNFLYSLSHVFSPAMVSDTKINFNRLTLQQPLNTAKQPIQPSLYFDVNFDRTVQGGTGTCLPGYSCFTPGNSIPFGGPQNVAQFSQSLSWTKGKHNLRFGGEYIYTQDNRTFGAYENAVQGLEPFGGTSVGSGLDNLMTGNAGWFQVVIDPQGKSPCVRDANGVYNVIPACTVNLPATQPSFSRSNRYKDGAVYAQDSWKATNRLTLNLGLRWEYYGVQHNQNPKLDSNFVYGSGGTIFDKLRNGQIFTVAATPNSPASPVGGLWKPQYHNFGPRVGFAYDVFGDGKTSLRGGYGIAYERNFGNVTFNVIQNPPAQFNSIFQGPGPGQPLATTNLGPFALAGTKFLPNPSLRYVRQDLPTSYSQSWNLALQREVLRTSVLSMEYTGAHTIHDYSIENLNQRGFGVIYLATDPVASSPVDRLNRQYGNMNTRGANGFSYYDALNTRFTSSNLFSQGLNFTVNYTYSHSIDNLSSAFSETPQTENLGLLDPFNPGLDKGSADFDARHRLAVSAVWTLPYAKNTHGFARQALDGWEVAPIVTAHTGNPFTVFDSTAFAGDTVVGRYIPPAGVAIPLTGSSGSTPQANQPGPNSYDYLNLPPSETYFNQFLFNAAGIVDGELPTCDTTTNGAGHLVSTGRNCHFPANMSSRNMFRAPGVYNINLAITKYFPITERFKLELRGEAYNLLNHSNYYVQNGSTNDAGNTGNNSAVFSAAPVPFQVVGKRGVVPVVGVPNERRFIQFALKLVF